MFPERMFPAAPLTGEVVDGEPALCVEQYLPASSGLYFRPPTFNAQCFRGITKG
jgi:hypothetical protein